ncbi:MAG: bifunctional nicotinamidase/pyrazinamidase [Waddliaceae bacterium]
MKALLLVDIQNDFLPGGALAVKEGDLVIPIANQLMEKFGHVIATQDWHPKGHSSFKEIWPVHCVQGSHGAEFPEALHTDRIHKVIRKGEDAEIDSYSAFFDNDQKTETGLLDYLREQNIDVLFIMGLATDYCVKYTVLDALAQGIKVYVIEDGCRAVNQNRGDGEKALKKMRQKGAKLVQSSERRFSRPLL